MLNKKSLPTSQAPRARELHLGSPTMKMRQLAPFAFALLFACAHINESPMPPPRNVPSAGAGFELALYQSTGVRFQSGTDVQLVYNGAIFGALTRAIRGAKTSINIVIYVWQPGEPSDAVIAAIEERTRAGVACRVMVDPVGSTPAFQRDVEPRLLSAHCDVRRFRPVHATHFMGSALSRNHRKIVILDGAVGFTGGFGIAKEWIGEGLAKDNWRDTSARIEGAVVSALQVAFAENWQEAGGPLLPASDFPEAGGESGKTRAAFVASSVQVGPSNADRLTQLALACAHKRLWIANAYFVPPEGILQILEEKARAGVDVRVLVPGPIDDEPAILPGQRSSYPRLIEAGVKVFEYQPAMLHAKTMVIDDSLSILGSMNLDPLSLNRLEEGSLVLLDPGLNENLAQHYEADLTHSKGMTLHSEEIPGFWGNLSRKAFGWLGDAPGR